MAPSGSDPSFFSRFFRRVPKQARSRALVESILQALEEAAARNPALDELRIEALAERAGVGIGSVYEYFSSKDSLLGALVGRATQRNFHELLAHAEAVDGDLEQAVREVATRVTDQYLAHPTSTRLLMMAIGKLDLWGVVVKERDRFSELLAQRAVRLAPELEPSALGRTMQLISDSVMGVLAAELARHQAPDRAAIAREIGDLAWAVVIARHPAVRPAEHVGCVP